MIGRHTAQRPSLLQVLCAELLRVVSPACKERHDGDGDKDSNDCGDGDGDKFADVDGDMMTMLLTSSCFRVQSLANCQNR